jgi:hypothetical protein
LLICSGNPVKINKEVHTVNAPIKEGREKLERILSALVDAPDCYIPVRGPWVPLNEAQQANWDARQTIGRLKREGFADLEETIGEFSPVVLDALVETPARVLVEAKQATLFS